MEADFLRVNIQRFGRDGWFFLRSDDIPGLCLFGPDLDDLVAQSEIAITELLRSRGDNVMGVDIEAIPAAPTHAWAAPVEHVAQLIPA